jgi:hypothetical protein
MSKEIGFIELNRRFEQLKPKLKPEEAAFESYTRSLLGEGYGLGWSELLQRRLVVVLGEPGSGKTEEFREQAKRRNAAGQYGFFVRLDQLTTQPLNVVLGSGDYKRYEEWHHGSNTATFFLDSVDEAKFHRLSDFFIALDRFRDALGTNALTKAKVLLSCRISEWQPQSDAAELLERFPLPPLARIADFTSRDIDGGEIGQPSTVLRAEKTEPILIVQVLPLDRKRVEQFAEARGLSDQKGFIQALDESHAWEFARRPVDFIDLVNFWSTRGRLGSLSELVEFNLENNLRLSERDRNDPLSLKEARDGVEHLAAATIFCRRFNFAVPDEMFLAEDSLDAFSCLPDHWQTQQVRALLSRPIFDGAAYGRIRFHHRRVAEYLAANWITRRMQDGCPTTELKELLFESHEGRLVIRPAAAPVAAWLCCGNQSWNNDVRVWVLQAAPNIHLQYGDPGCLTVEYRRNMLQALVRAYEGRSHVWIASSPDSLARLGDPVLAQEISALISNHGLSQDLRIELIQLVRHGRLVQALDAVLDVVAADDEPDHLKSYAATAVRDAGDGPSRRRLAEIAAHLSKIPNTVCSRIFEALYPETIYVPALLALLRKTDPVAPFSVDFPYYLKTHLKEVMKPADAADILRGLIDLGQTPPHLSLTYKNGPVSDQFSWVKQVIPTLVDMLLQKPSLSSEESAIVANALWWLGLTSHFPLDSVSEKVENVQVLTHKHPTVRRHYFWQQVRAWRREHNTEPKDQFEIFDDYENLRPEMDDLRWLVEDGAERSESADRELALRFALEIWNNFGRHWRWRRLIRGAVANDAALRLIFRQTANTGYLKWCRQLWYRHIVYRIGPSWRWEQRLRKIKIRLNSFRTELFLLRNLVRLASGDETQWLLWSINEAITGRSQRSDINWNDVRKNRWRLIRWATRRGCKRAWRSFVPKLPHELEPMHTEQRTIVGLLGLQAEIADGEIDFLSLSEEEAKIAVRYAVNELNGFAPWLKELAKQRPEVVRHVVSECIRGEWGFKADREHTYEVMHDLVWHGDAFIHLLRETLLELLRSGDPPNYSILRYGLTILLNQKEPAISELKAIAGKRVRDYAPNEAGFILWLAVWLQIDAQPALIFLQKTLKTVAQPDHVMLRVCSALSGEYRDRSPVVPNPDYLRTDALRTFIPVVYSHIRPADDIERAGGGVYTPGERDHAQKYRNELLSRLATIEDSEATTILRGLAEKPVMAVHRDWILHLLDDRIERESELPPWNATDIRSFTEEHEIDPKTDRDLFKIAGKRLIEIKNDVEKSDNSLREEMHRDYKEPALRRWLARKLNERSRKRYTVPQEEEIDQQERPDLRIETPKTNPVSVEVKWADNWTLPQLLERLENQLLGQYLRAYNSRHGIYLLGTIGRKKHWQDPQGGEPLVFQEVVDIVKARARALVADRSGVEDIAVIDIDFSTPERSAKRTAASG